jgi:hypothetical protein
MQAAERIFYSFLGRLPQAGENMLPEAEMVFAELQRAEEYNLPHQDEKGRFPAEMALRVKQGKAEEAPVDNWFDDAFPGVYASEYGYTCIPTFDVDHAYAFRGKGVWKNAVGLLKNGLNDPERFQSRIAFLRGKQPDPYDTYGYILQVCHSLGLKPLFFIQMGSYANGYDVNLNFRHSEGRNLIRFLAREARVGLHPSFASNQNSDLLRREYDLLSDIVGEPVRAARQHFLMLRFPDTYRRLEALGIREDYSMGWPSHTGFRAGTCRPFRWYDIRRELFSELTVFPFACMDGTLHEYLKLSPEQALNRAESLIHTTRKHQGVFVPLWHNHTVNNRFEWKEWQAVFEQMLALSCP